MSGLNNPTDIARIQGVTDNLPNTGYLTDISDETDKIDLATADGLQGTHYSLSYYLGEIHRHLHSQGRWFEKAGTPEGEFHVADRIGLGTGAFRIDAGNDTWGDWLQILGSQDTPVNDGDYAFDPHQFVVEDTERNATYFVQIAAGSTGAAALTAGTYVEFVYSATVQKEVGIVKIQTGRALTGTKLWARCMCPDNDTGWLDFYFGLHCYEG